MAEDRPPRSEHYPPDVSGDAAELRWDLAVVAAPKLLGDDATAGELRYLVRHLYNSDIET